MSDQSPDCQGVQCSPSSRFKIQKFCSDFSEQVQDSDFLSFAPIFRSKFKIRIFKVLLRKIGASSRFKIQKFCSDFSEQVQDSRLEFKIQDSELYRKFKIQDSRFKSFAPKNRSKFKIRIFKVLLRKIGAS